MILTGPTGHNVDTEIIRELTNGRRLIQLIKEYRAFTGEGLREAKNVVDANVSYLHSMVEAFERHAVIRGKTPKVKLEDSLDKPWLILGMKGRTLRVFAGANSQVAAQTLAHSKAKELDRDMVVVQRSFMVEKPRK